jgi:hypothetical protein
VGGTIRVTRGGAWLVEARSAEVKSRGPYEDYRSATRVSRKMPAAIVPVSVLGGLFNWTKFVFFNVATPAYCPPALAADHTDRRPDDACKCFARVPVLSAPPHWFAASQWARMANSRFGSKGSLSTAFTCPSVVPPHTCRTWCAAEVFSPVPLPAVPGTTDPLHAVQLQGNTGRIGSAAGHRRDDDTGALAAKAATTKPYGLFT